MERLLKRWKQYRYRFVPWIALNLKDRSVRSVPKGTADKLAVDGDILHTLVRLLSAFHQCCDSKQHTGSATLRSTDHCRRTAHHHLDLMREVMGFKVQRQVSSIVGGGQGVVVTEGWVPKGTVTSLYPGLIYENYEPVLFQSLGNPFIFRCIDSLLIDGNDKGVSRFLYRTIIYMMKLNVRVTIVSWSGSCGPLPLCDASWLTEFPINPLAVGQYVNNHNKEHPANVAYQELDVPADFPLHLRQYLPNNYYSSSLERLHQGERLTRLVVLVATRDIDCGEELFSSYFTVVH